MRASMAKLKQVAGVVGCMLSSLAACGGASKTSAGSDGGTDSGPGGGGSTSAGAPTSNAGHATGGSGPLVGGSSSLGGHPSGGADGGHAGDPLPEGGVSGLGGDAGTPNCPAIKCAASCPGEPWLGPDGCATCACAPPAPELTHEAWSCPNASLTLASTSGYFIGGIDRLLISFDWQCAAVSLGGPSRATLEVGLVQTSPSPPPLDDAANHTFYWPASPGLPSFEVRSAKVWLRGSGVPEIEVPLLGNSSFLSIRREGDELVGGVHYVGEDSSGAHPSTLAGPFRVPVPSP
jgi:hypothetical protein